MTKKKVIFWRFSLIFIIIFGIYFIALNFLGVKKKNIYQIIKKLENNIDDDKIIEKEIELSIRPDDFYKKKKDKIN